MWEMPSRSFFNALKLVLIALIALHPSFPAQAKLKSATHRMTKSGSIAQGITAAVYLSPSSTANTSPDRAVSKALEEARRLFKDLDAQSSGEVSQINKGAGKDKIKVSGPLLTLLKVCRQITDWTHGLFDVVRGVSNKKDTLFVDFENNEVRLPTKKSWLDFTGIRNGYIVDRMAGMLKSQGYSDFMVQMGDSTRTMGRDGANYWRLNIPDVHGSQSGLCRVSLESSSVATVNTRTLPQTKTDLRSVTVITRNATNASALARTAFLAGRSRAVAMLNPLAAQGFGVILEDGNGKIQTIGDVTAACFEE